MYKPVLQRLVIFTQIYLAVPFFVFCLAWLKPAFAVVLLLMLCYAAWQRKDENTAASPISRSAWLLILLTAAAWVCLAFPLTWLGYCNDSPKHVAMLRDLVYQPWPVVYGNGESLVYYTGFYMLPALAGKLAGYNAALAVAGIWTFCGVVLSLSWFVHLSGNARTWPVLLFFVLFSGFDVLAAAGEGLKALSPDQLENAATPYLQYSAFSTLIGWVPQHAVSGWLAASLLLTARSKWQCLWLIPVLMLWSVFCAAGAALLWLVVPGKLKPEKGEILKTVAAVLFCLAGAAVMLAWFSTPAVHLAWSFMIHNSRELLLYLVFITCELLLWLPVWRWYKPAGRSEMILSRGVLILLLLIPLAGSPANNDWCMRASIPLLFVFALFVLKGLDQVTVKPRIYRMLVLLLLVLASVNPLLQLAKGGKALYSSLKQGEHPMLEDVKTKGEAVPALQKSGQYMGNTPAFFFRQHGH